MVLTAFAGSRLRVRDPELEGSERTKRDGYSERGRGGILFNGSWVVLGIF